MHQHGVFLLDKEWCKEYLEHAKAAFTACDSNGDKGITWKEVKAIEVGVL